MTLIRFILFVWLVSFLISTYKNNVVKGSSRRLSQEEDNELETQLKLLNKPAIQTIQTKYGDIYDCVDFYKQPAFDHPLLRNHSFHFQMRPTSMPKQIKERELSTTNTTTVFHTMLKGVGCPYGTVPIKRVTKDDLIRAELQRKRYNSIHHSNLSVLTLDKPGTHYALVRTKFDPKKRYNGGGTGFSIYKPIVGTSQYSSARMRIQNGPDSIEVGWTVNPTLYGNNDVRLYTYLKTSQSQCFNTQCPGFVIVNTDIPLGDLLPVTQRGKLPTYILDVLIYRDPANGNWWLEVGDDFTQIGFWPQRIFTGLADSAFTVEWGGEVFSPPDIPSPPMGSSYYPKLDTRYDGFCSNMTTINEAHKIVEVANLENYKDVDDGYEVINVGELKYFGYLVDFGGPGGTIGN